MQARAVAADRRPRAPTAEPSAPAEPASGFGWLGTVVVAEDDDATRMILCRVLRRHRYRVIDVENGKLARDAARREQPDIVLLDWTMPVMDGLTALAALKSDPATQDIPVVLLTARSEIDERRLALEAGVNDFLTKPCDTGELIARLARLPGRPIGSAAATGASIFGTEANAYGAAVPTEP